MRGKKGAGHFEMIMAFVFFMGFVFFMFMFISPWDNSALPSSALKQLYDSFSENVSVPLSSVFIKANDTIFPGDCFFIDLPTELFTLQDISGKNTRVTRLGGVEIASNIDGEDLVLSENSDHFRAAISPEFNAGIETCSNNNTDFELGGVVEIEVVSNRSLTQMRDNYYSNYTKLKRDLRVPYIFDFAIVPEGLPNLTMEFENGPPASAEVLAKDYVVRVLTADGMVSNERISFRIW